MPKRNPLNSGKPTPLDFGVSRWHGNPERITWEQVKRATTHSADRTPAVWARTVPVCEYGGTINMKICDRCGKEYNHTSNRQRFCLGCKEIARKEHVEAYNKRYHRENYERKGYNQKGENNNNWKSGIGAYRRMVEKKKCARCGATHNLLVHHKDGNRQNNSPDNLEVLCKRCHQLEHGCTNNLPSPKEVGEMRSAWLQKQEGHAVRDEFGRFIKVDRKV